MKAFWLLVLVLLGGCASHSAKTAKAPLTPEQQAQQYIAEARTGQQNYCTFQSSKDKQQRCEALIAPYSQKLLYFFAAENKNPGLKNIETLCRKTLEPVNGYLSNKTLYLCLRHTDDYVQTYQHAIPLSLLKAFNRENYQAVDGANALCVVATKPRTKAALAQCERQQSEAARAYFLSKYRSEESAQWYQQQCQQQPLGQMDSDTDPQEFNIYNYLALYQCARQHPYQGRQ
ncbi:hypothetical protein [Gallaecimonas mangrovi]|uniref:hypothetical protein n=1 Tax=Gallaecimonas mangrovi TaxID=2291597 RepID=UPI000E20B84E|nr:hypothetical protein [Gallaecimonas mangrovi]